MLCRALLTALAISYLICVLWLSGLQKEDLDVNMLRKLQRHNVNIDDKNRDSLRQDCLNPDTRNDNKNGEKIMNISEDETRAITTTPESETKIIKHSDEFEPKIDMHTMLDINEQKLRSPDNYSTIIQQNPELTVSPLENNSETLTQKNSATEKLNTLNVIDKTKLDSVINFWRMFTTPKYKDLTGSVTKRSRSTTSKSVKVSPENTKIVEFKGRSKEVKIINKLLADYIDKTTQPTTTENTIISNADLSNLYKFSKQFQEFMKIMAESNKIAANNINTSATHNTSSNDNLRTDSDIPQQTLIIRSSKQKYTETKSKKHTVSDISDLLFINDQIKRSSALTNETFSPSNQIDEIDWLNNNQFYKTESTAYPLSSIVKSEFNQQERDMFSKDLIEKIVENVKTIVLKDLRQEITLTTSVYTSSSAATEISVTSNNTLSKTEIVHESLNNENKIEETKQVLKNIMELVKELKDLKEKTFTTTSKTAKPIENFDTENVYSLPIQIMKPHIRAKSPEMISAYKTYEPKNNAENGAHSNISKAKMRIDNGPKFTPVKLMRESTIIQTNSGEIPPLGVPLTKPLQFIHQNIVVTIAPLVKTLHSTEQWTGYNSKTSDRDKIKKLSENYRYSNNSQYNPIPINRQIGHSLHKPKTIYQYPNIQESYHESYRDPNRSVRNQDYFHRGSSYLHHNTDFSHRTDFNKDPLSRAYYRLSLDANQNKTNYYPSKHDLTLYQYNTDASVFRETKNNERYEWKDQISRNAELDDKLNLFSMEKDVDPWNKESKMRENYFKNNNRALKKPHEDTVGSPNHHLDIKGFHERLERVDDWRDETKDDKKEKECCNALKLASRQQLALNGMKTRYDDSHFKNFLKTQQKVNDMLEKILSSKNSEPHSVEIM